MVAGRRERTPQQACLGQSPGLGRTAQEERLGQYQTPGVGRQAIWLVFLKPFSTGLGLDGRKQAPWIPHNQGQMDSSPLGLGEKPPPGSFFPPPSLWQKITSYGTDIEQEQYTERKLIQQTLNLLGVKK